jgi:hypothetical protein
VDASRIHSGQVELEHQVVRTLVDVDVRSPGGGRVAALVKPREVLEETVDLVLDPVQLEERTKGFHRERPPGGFAA